MVFCGAMAKLRNVMSDGFSTIYHTRTTYCRVTDKTFEQCKIFRLVLWKVQKLGSLQFCQKVELLASQCTIGSAVVWLLLGLRTLWSVQSRAWSLSSGTLLVNVSIFHATSTVLHVSTHPCVTRSTFCQEENQFVPKLIRYCRTNRHHSNIRHYPLRKVHCEFPSN